MSPSLFVGRLAPLLLGLLACGRGVGVAAPDVGDLLILDADAGQLLPDGERAGVLFVARCRGDGGFGPPEVLASDPRWREPTDLLLLGDGTVLVLDSAWAPGAGEARGALFLVEPERAGRVTLWWSDERLRQPVALVRDGRGTVYVSDRQADPLGLGRPTGCVLAIPCEVDAAEAAARPGSADRGAVEALGPGAGAGAGAGRPGPAHIAAAGPELVTPGALAFDADGALLVMDADANPRGVLFEDGRPGTPGVLYRLAADGSLKTLLEPLHTVSPIGLVTGEAGGLFVVDANYGQRIGVMGDGALLRRTPEGLELLVDSLSLQRPRALVDPAGGDTLPDGRLLLADANADPLGLGQDGTGKGVYGTGHGAVLLVDPVARTVQTAVADGRLVMPLAVRRVRP